jgi:hypothetical protein
MLNDLPKLNHKPTCVVPTCVEISCTKMPQMISNFNHKIFLLPYLYDGISMFVEWFVAC